MIKLDGAMGEGGGQILRSALALSLLTGKPFHLRRIRARRPKPGLQPQHLMSVRAAMAVGQAEAHGASLGSAELTFWPGSVQSSDYRFDIGTAGATGLVLHTLYLPLALRGSRTSTLTLVGGTHVSTSPCFHFLETTWRPFMERFGMSIRLEMIRPGFYPRGGGEIVCKIDPVSQLVGLRAEARGPVRISGFSAVAGLTSDIARRQARQAERRLKAADQEISVREENWVGGPGTVLGLVAHTAPVDVLFFGLGERRKPAERVADEAVDQLLAYLDSPTAAVDPHSADQILLPLVFAPGPSCFTVSEITDHLTTNLDVIRRFLDRDIHIEGKPGRPGRVEIKAAAGSD